jgi:hypothetical protein
MITYIEDKSDKYPPRTFANAAAADATIAFAVDFNTAGEKLTKIATKKVGKIYIPVDIMGIRFEQAAGAAITLMNLPICVINIAGNSVATLGKHSMSQRGADVIVEHYIFWLLAHKVNISTIRSGGQSGFDEAGIKAALKLDIPAIVHCPKGWKFINEKGETICDERLFKKRFEV